jgi:membrane fusion protein, copper/silver efflux system
MQLKPHILIISGLALLAIGIVVGWAMTDSSEGKNEAESVEQTATDEIWTCSMHPQIQRSQPGLCPICGMDLIPLAKSENSTDPLAIHMSENAMKLANIQTTIVGSGENQQVILLNGKVAVNEKLRRSQSAHVSGRVEELNIDFTGEFIHLGQEIASIYSPELVTAQRELIIAHESREQQPELFESAKQKLRLWKLSDKQIDEIIESKKIQESIPLLANTRGYVMLKNVSVGDYVKSGQSLYSVADLSTVWLMFDIYESEMEGVKEGDAATVTVTAIPGKTFHGKIDYIDPIIDPTTRVANARIELTNSKTELKPGMFAKAVLVGSNSAHNEITVPKSAVMWTGKRSIVYIKTNGENGLHFRLREVLLGQSLGDRYLVKEGLVIGEEIATNGTFSIDAAAQLEGKPSMMNPEDGVIPTGHNHGGESSKTKVKNNKIDHSTMDHDQALLKSPATNNPKSNTEPIQEPPKQLLDLLDTYFLLKTSLTKTDYQSAKKYAAMFNQGLVKIEMSTFKGPSHETWIGVKGILISESMKMAKASDMGTMRIAFKSLSESAIQLASEFGEYGTPLYIQYCPMADRNKGGFWMSQQENIINPYFGQSMLSCGSTKNQL